MQCGWSSSSWSTYVSVIHCPDIIHPILVSACFIEYWYYIFSSPCMHAIFFTLCVPRRLSWSHPIYLWFNSLLHHHPSLPHPSLNPVEFVSPPSPPSVLQSTCDTLRSHSDSLGFTPNMLPRHPTLGNFEEFACWQHNGGVGGGVAHLGTWQQTVK